MGVNEDPAGFVLRDYTASDFPAICRVHDFARPLELEGSFDADAFVPLGVNPEGNGVLRCRKWVAEVDGEVVGFSGVDGAYVAWLYVDPAHHGRGIGRALLRRALQVTGAAATVMTCGNNHPAIGLYESEGFEVVERFTAENNGRPGPLIRLRWAGPRSTGPA